MAVNNSGDPPASAIWKITCRAWCRQNDLRIDLDEFGSMASDIDKETIGLLSGISFLFSASSDTTEWRERKTSSDLRPRGAYITMIA
jgi:hypothetical protein